MEIRDFDVTDILDENLELAENTLQRIKSQGNQIQRIEESNNYVDYLLEKSGKILDRMGSFFNRVWNRPINYNEESPYVKIQMDKIDNPGYENNDILGKLDRLKNLGIQMGENLEEQNIQLDKLDLDVDKNKSFIQKNNNKIKKIL